MIRIDMIGHLGADAVVQQHGTESVINFNLAHTDRYTQNGTKMEKVTWVNCSWWTEKHTVAQYLKKGTQVFISGIPGVKTWKNKNGELQSGLNIRIYSLQLCGGGGQRDNNQQQSSQQAPIASSSNTTPNDQNGYVPMGDSTDLPF